MIRRLVAWIRGDRLDLELDDELSFHVEAHTRDLIAGGLPAEEARRRALAAFGGRTPIKERTKDAHGRRWLADLAMDGRYALRALRRQPGFAVVTLLTLTLGIGANTAIFSMVNAVLLRPLPVRDPGRLVLFSPTAGQGTRTSRPFPDGRWDTFSTDTYTFLRSQPSPLASIAAFESGDYIGSLDLPGRGAADRVDVDFVSGNYFEVLGGSPTHGRALTPDDDRPGAPPVAVASDRFWREHLDADPQAAGRTIKVDDAVVTIVGVMPQAFFGVRVQRSPDIWTPLSRRHPGVSQRTDLHWLSLIGRLGDGQSIERAKTAMTGSLRQYVSAQLQAPLDENTLLRLGSVHVEMVDGSRGISYTRMENRRLLVLLLSAVGVILLIACANVGTLFLARAASREREVAVRGALGASRGRLVRQWLTESALLGGAGAISGALAAWVTAPRLLATFVPANVPVTATIDGVVLMFTTGITLLASLLFGLAPSLSAGHVDPLATLRLSGSARPRRRLLGMTEPFIVAQIAMSLVLVLAATLLVRTLLNLADAPFGFIDRDRVLLTPINPRPAGYRSADVGSLYRRIYESVQTLPGVESATFARFGPFSGRWSSFESTVEGYAPRPGETIRLDAVQVGPRYPETLGIPLVQGRAIDLNDVMGAPRVAMVNEAFVERFFGSRSPLGHHFAFKNRDTYEIVGVVKDAQYHLAREPIPPTVLTAMLQETTGMALDCEIEVRTRGDATALASGVRQAIAIVDSRVALRRSVTLRDQVSSTFAPERTAAGFIVSFAVLALLVASVGLYGVVSHGLAKRTNEIGVRVALGAARGDVVWLVARETLVRLAIGLLIGLAVAQAGRGLLSSQLFGVTSSDPLSLAVAAAVLACVVALATLRPLRRALRIDPVGALRAE